MSKQKTIQNLKVGVFNDMTPKTGYVLTMEEAPKWEQNQQSKITPKSLSKVKSNQKRPSYNSGHRE